MPPEAKTAVGTITKYAAGATVLGILIQFLIFSFWFGGSLAQKADHQEVEAIRQEWAGELRDHEKEFSEHCIEQAGFEGEIKAQLKAIAVQVGAPVVLED